MDSLDITNNRNIIQNKLEIYYPYVRKQCEFPDTYKIVSYDVSPNNIHMVVECLYNDNIIIKLFGICSENGVLHVKHVMDLLTFSGNCNDLSYSCSYLWSSTGNMLLCEYVEEYETMENYNIVYFNMLDDYKRTNLYVSEEHKWEHKVTFSHDDSIMLTVYNFNELHVFVLDFELKQYRLVNKLKSVHNISNLYFTNEKRVILSLYGNTQIIINAYQLMDDFDIVMLNTCIIDSYYYISKMIPYSYENNNYLLCYLIDYTDNVYHDFYVYNLDKLIVSNGFEMKLDMDEPYIRLLKHDIYGDYIPMEMIHEDLTVLFNMQTKIYSLLPKEYKFISNNICDDRFNVYDITNDTHGMTRKFKLFNITQVENINADTIHMFRTKCKTPMDSNCDNNYIIIMDENTIGIAQPMTHSKEKNIPVVDKLTNYMLSPELICVIVDYII